MITLVPFLLSLVGSLLKPKMRLEAENAVLRHQLIVLKRRLHGRVRLTNNDHSFFMHLYQWFPAILQVLTIIRPETLVVMATVADRVSIQDCPPIAAPCGSRI